MFVAERRSFVLATRHECAAVEGKVTATVRVKESERACVSDRRDSSCPTGCR